METAKQEIEKPGILVVLRFTVKGQRHWMRSIGYWANGTSSVLNFPMNALLNIVTTSR